MLLKRRKLASKGSSTASSSFASSSERPRGRWGPSKWQPYLQRFENYHLPQNPPNGVIWESYGVPSGSRVWDCGVFPMDACYRLWCFGVPPFRSSPCVWYPRECAPYCSDGPQKCPQSSCPSFSDPQGCFPLSCLAPTTPPFFGRFSAKVPSLQPVFLFASRAVPTNSLQGRGPLSVYEYPLCNS